MNAISDQSAGPRAGPRRRRRLHSDEFKADVVARCMQPGMSMAAVAMAHGVNANLLRGWVRAAELRMPSIGTDKPGAGEVQALPAKPMFVPVPLPAPAVPGPPADIRIELQGGTTAITVTWPSSVLTPTENRATFLGDADPNLSQVFYLPCCLFAARG